MGTKDTVMESCRKVREFSYGKDVEVLVPTVPAITLLTLSITDARGGDRGIYYVWVRQRDIASPSTRVYNSRVRDDGGV